MAAAAAAAILTRRTSSFRLHFRPIISSSLTSSSSIPSSRSRSSISWFQRSFPSFRRGPAALSSLLPMHSATASARLVSKLSSDANACIEGRFANYLSPI